MSENSKHWTQNTMPPYNAIAPSYNRDSAQQVTHFTEMGLA